jgi:hypothetical protein
MAVYNGLGNRTLTTHTMRALKQMIRAMMGGPSAVSFTNSTSPTTHGGAHGVAGDGDLKVTAQGSPNMSVLVAPGEAFILQDANAHAGTGTIYNDAALTVPIATSDPSNPRIDLIVAQMRDNVEDASTFNDWRIFPVAGTPAGSPGVPAIPAGCLVLAQIAVGAAVVSITNANITEKRVWAALAGGMLRVATFGQLPTGVAKRIGMWAITVDTGTVYYCDHTLTWQIETMPWTTYTPTLTQPGAITKTATYARYQQSGKTVTVNFRLDVTGTGTSANLVLVGLPVAAAAATAIIGTGSIYDDSTGIRYVCQITGNTTTTCKFSIDGTSSNAWGIAPAIALANQDAIIGSLTYEAA